MLIKSRFLQKPDNFFEWQTITLNDMRYDGVERPYIDLENG